MRSRLAQSDIILGSCLVLLASCTSITSFGGSDGTEDGTESESSGGILPSGSDQGSGAPTDNGSSSSGMDASSSDGSGSDETEGNSFIDSHDWPGCRDPLPDGVLAHSPLSCSVMDQDCCPEEACRAWADDGGSIWNSTRCSPVDPDAGQAGDPCIAEGSAVSGADSCDIGLMCWEVDSNTLQGTCIEYCSGTPDAPTCDDSATTCSISHDGVLALCLPLCDPLLGNCGTGAVCAPTPADEFACIPGELSSCPEGMLDVPTENVAGCVDGEPCCTLFCDTAEGNACEDGMECVPYFAEPEPAHPDLGLCVSAT